MASSEVEGNGSTPFQRVGRFAAGSLVASANVAQRGFHAGLGAWARMLQTTAEAAGDAVPGADRLAEVAGRTAEQASAQAAQAERRTAQAVAFARDFVAVAKEAGTATLGQTFALAEAAVRLAAGDPEPLRLSIDEGLAQMRLLAAAGELGDLLPASPLDEPLQRRARLVVERSPRRFLDALEGNGHRPRPTAVLQAAFLDADELRVFLVVYPQTLSLIAAKVGRLLMAGELELRQVEAFLRGRRRAAGLSQSSKP